MTEKKNTSILKSKSRRAGLNQGGSFLNDTYDDFIKNKGNNLSREISRQLFKTIMKDFYSMIATVILDGKEIAIPCGIGNLVVNKKASDLRKVTNFKETNEQGRTVLEYNSHTDGYRFSIQWRKSSPIFGIQNGYQFKASRILARELAKTLKNGYGYKYQSLSNKKVDKYEV